MKDGLIIHIERGYRIVEVLETINGDDEVRCIGYRVMGPGADAGHIYSTEQQARIALMEMSGRDGGG